METVRGDGRQSSLKTAKVLIVDGEDAFRLLMNESLRENGYDVSEARSAEDALDKIGETFFDLLITDVEMPGMNGLELLSKVKMRYPATKVIVMTGSHDPYLEEYSMTYGAEDFIMKSLHSEELLLELLLTVDLTLAGRNQS